jgi:hypothetical protein
VLTSSGDRREAPDFEEGRRWCWQPAVVFKHGGAPVLGWRRGEVEDARLDIAELLMAATSSGRASRWRIDDGGAPAGGGARARGAMQGGG